MDEPKCHQPFLRNGLLVYRQNGWLSITCDGFDSHTDRLSTVHSRRLFAIREEESLPNKKTPVDMLSPSKGLGRLPFKEESAGSSPVESTRRLSAVTTLSPTFRGR